MKRFGAVLIMLMVSSLWATAQEYKYHPIFIYNFSKYIEWPPPSANSDFVICVVGDEQAYQQMMNISQKKKTIKNQNLVVKKCNTLNEVERSNIVFITKNTKVSSEEIKNRFTEQGTLVITEHKGMAERGAHINFIATADSKIGFELNTTSTQDAGLKVANALATLAAKTY